ncbi:MAG: hypothetical protein IKG11_10095 [Atopobiaceae bacterium]|nr:hypothetical protein [Atopobiaceae bacterium]
MKLPSSNTIQKQPSQVAREAAFDQRDAGAKGTPDARAWELAVRVIDLARGRIVAGSPFLSASIGLLATEPSEQGSTYACNGQTLYVRAAKVLATFSQTRTPPVHDLLHILLHCLLLHPFVGNLADEDAWSLASDMVAESLVRELAGPREGERGTALDKVLDQLAHDLRAPLTTERLYHALCDGAYASKRARWQKLFFVDDHSLWFAPKGKSGGQSGQTEGQQDSQQGEHAGQQDKGADAQGSVEEDAPAKQTKDEDRNSPGSASHEDDSPAPLMPASLTDAQRKQAEQAWSHVSKSMRVDLETLSRSQGASLGNLVRELSVDTHERMDYRTFLRQFAVEREDMRLSDDEFDYVFYTYGLELYHDMPLIEPLEYRTEKRIRDFAVVIDTSSSVQASVVQEFIDATFDVLTSEGGFFSKTNIHIIQADARVQSDVKISSVADLDRWRHNIKLHGFGGTDFRPAFRYVQQLRQEGEFDDLQGLVYFTDGWGIYPERMPPYKCAFVFYDEDHRPELVPPWAIQLVLHPGEFKSMSAY